MEWIKTTLVGKGVISEEEVNLLTLVDSIDETIEIIAEHYMNTYSSKAHAKLYFKGSSHMDINTISATLINNSLPIIAAFNLLIHIFCGLGIAKDIPKVLDRRLTTILLPKIFGF